SLIVDIGNDMKAIGRSIKIAAGATETPPAQSQVVVEVRVLNRNAASESGYEVCYRSKYEEPTAVHVFDQFTDKAIRPMVGVTYVFWAKRPSGTQKTAEREIPVRDQPKSSRQIIDLSIQ